MNAGERQVQSRLVLEAAHCVEIRSTRAIRFANNSKNRPAAAAMCCNPRNSNYFFLNRRERNRFGWHVRNGRQKVARFRRRQIRYRAHAQAIQSMRRDLRCEGAFRWRKVDHEIGFVKRTREFGVPDSEFRNFRSTMNSNDTA
jgi:hypothetical protein